MWNILENQFFFFFKNDKPESNIGEFPYNPEQFKVFEQGSDKSKIFKKKVKFSFRKITVGEEGRLALKEDTLEKGALLG